MIRGFEDKDFETAKRIHAESGLPEECFPDLITLNDKDEAVPNPLFVAKEVFEHDGQPVMMCFLKVRSELYLLVDHSVGTPEERWEWLREFKVYMNHLAWKLGFDQMTAFVPTDIDESFRKRLEELGFIRSPWVPYTLNVE